MDWTVRDRMAVGERFFAPVQTGPGAYPASCTKGTGHSRGKQPELGLNHRRGQSKITATLLTPYCAFMAGCRAKFTFLPFTYNEAC
jgi:hypothetical protein